MNTPDCVPRDRLEKYVLGDLSAEDWQAVAAHVEACGRCEETVSQLDLAEDTLVKTLREPAKKDSEPTAYRLAAQRAKSQRLPASMDRISEAAAPAQCVRDYELLEPIARGGMGTVYRAIHRRLGRQVALKVLPSRCLANSHAVSRFQREMQAVGQLRHPAIVQATDGGEVDGVHFLVMELVEGIDLNSLVKCVGPLSHADACELARRTAIGLGHAHEQGIIHRDVKPSNLMLTAEGEIKILDLGLARIVGEQLVCDELTTVGQLMGTLDYMAPEQFENSHEADERCDVYGLGATLFKLLAGHAPYSEAHRDSPLAKLRRIAGNAPPLLSTKRGELPNDLCEFVDRMLARRPEDRPATMIEIAAGLERWCSGHRLRELALDGLAKRTSAHDPQELADSKLVPGPFDGKPPVPADDQGAAIAALREANTESRSRRFRSWIAALLLLSGLAALAAVITVQTSGGQLVIETSVPDIEVRIVRAGQPFKTLTLTQQPNTLRLGAGEYEVQLIGPADGLQIENNKFTLTRGATVVARVVHNPVAGARPTVPDPNAPVAAETTVPRVAEPRYDGKTTAEWIVVLKEDRSPSRVIAAFEALQKLALDQIKQDEAIQTVFQAARYHDSESSVRSSDGKGHRWVWQAASETLGSFDASTVVAYASALLDDPAYRPKQFIPYLLFSNLARYRPHVSERLRNQLIHQVRNGPDPERQTAISLLANLQGENDSQFVAQCRAWLSEKDAGLRLHAASRLVAAKQATEEVVDVLRQMLQTESPDIRAESAAILRDMGGDAKPAVPDLIAIIEAKDQATVNRCGRRNSITNREVWLSVQDQAIESLGTIGDQSAVPVLIRERQRRVMLHQSKQVPEDVDVEETVAKAIRSLTGLATRDFGSGISWHLNDVRLADGCLKFLNTTAASTERRDSRDAIKQLLKVSSESDVEKAVASAIAMMPVESIERGTPRVLELIEMLRPMFPAKHEYRAMLQALSLQSGRKSSRDNTFPAGPSLGSRLIQRMLTDRAAASAEALGQIFDALAEAIELDPGRELILYVDTLVVLGVPDADRTKRIAAALEKARDVEIPWKNEAVIRGLEHLRGQSEEPKPSPEK